MVSIEDTYRKYTQLEHVLARPGMYIGEITNVTAEAWTIENEVMVLRELTWNPGLYKLFDEVLVNAIDHSQRSTSVKKISVDINSESISILNDGPGIPIEIHKDYNIYVPELIFGNLLSSSNYDDSKKRTVGGTNGLGAKLANIYSTEFIVETCCNGKKYTQVFSENMTKVGKPKIVESTKEYTRITFKPDFKRFGVSNLDEKDNIKVLSKRVYDASATTNKNVTVYLNNQKIKVKDFQNYMDLFIGQKKDAPRVYEEFGTRWKIGVAISSFGEFKQVSFVNGIACSDGGSHVEHILYQLTKAIAEELQSKHKNLNIKPQYVKEHIFLFINCLIENPTFASQTKDKHTTKVSEFGSRCTVNQDFINKTIKLGFIDQLLRLAEAKEKKNLAKTDGKKTGRVSVPKLDDANKAGTNESAKCTLILTEGDSAKTTAISGLSIIGRDYFGVFPLRGKLLNTRVASYAQISKNEEINNIKKILGLQTGKKYKSVSELRYGSILVMTDQDVDGYHIKSLIVNFIHCGWPELLRNNVFIESLLTPIIKVSKKNQVLSFYNIPDYIEWKKQNSTPGWNTKYYKGLGTSTAKEAKEYFKEMKKLSYIINSQEDENALDLAFNKVRSDDRKVWIVKSTGPEFKSLEYKTSKISVQELVNKELVLFSKQDNERSIPSLVDGLKPSQRKILYSCFLKKLKKELKVAQLAGYVSEKSCYHHGETSLMDAIISMAQDFVGSNNWNLLVPAGQFGTRYQGGKDSSSPRYIFTYLSKYTDTLFNPDDFPLLDYLEDDGIQIEPKFYVPTLPLLLINGSQGIGTGFSTTIPCFNPEDIKNRLLKLALNEDSDIEPLTPWYRDFTGKIEKIEDNKWISFGVLKEVDENIIKITELPIGTWTEDYKLFLDKLEEEDKISWYKNNSTEKTVEFQIRIRNNSNWKNDYIKFFKLSSYINAQNMHVFDEQGKICKMDSPEEIIWKFYKIRTDYFQKRKDYLINKFTDELLILKSKYEFILSIIEDRLVVFRKKKNDIIEKLINSKFEYYKKDNSFQYLLELPVSSFTDEKLTELENQINDKRKHLEEITEKTIQNFWIESIGDVNSV